MAGDGEQGQGPAPRRRRGGPVRARQRLAAALALAVAGGAAAADCPKELGRGLVLSTADGAMSLTYRPLLPGLVAQERIDDRPGMPEVARRLSSIMALGIISIDVHGPGTYLRTYLTADPAGLARLAETGVWQSDLTGIGGTTDRQTSVVQSGRQVIRFLGHETRTIGGCRYAVWALEHSRTVARPDQPDRVQLFRQWWAPALGVAVGVTDPTAEGFGPEVPFARIEALD